MVLGIPSLVFGISEVGTTGTFNSPEVIWPVIAGLLLISAFIRHAHRAERPLLDVRLYANRVGRCRLANHLRAGCRALWSDDPDAALLPADPRRKRDRDGLLLAPQVWAC